MAEEKKKQKGYYTKKSTKEILKQCCINVKDKANKIRYRLPPVMNTMVFDKG